LKKRLEARRKKRAQLEDKLNGVDDSIEAANKGFEEKRKKLLDDHEKDYQKAVKVFEVEHDQEKGFIEEDLKDRKQELLASLEEKLKEANKDADFSKVLGEYQVQ